MTLWLGAANNMIAIKPQWVKSTGMSGSARVTQNHRFILLISLYELFF